jgi:hypothetical protein
VVYGLTVFGLGGMTQKDVPAICDWRDEFITCNFSASYFYFANFRSFICLVRQYNNQRF